MRKLILLTLAIAWLAGGSAVAAAISQEQNEKSLADLMTQIRQSQGVSDNSRIDADRVHDSMLEQLGDAVLDQRVRDDRMHEWVEQMLGGEGSPSLAAMYRIMGYRHLTGKQQGILPQMMGGMMGRRWRNWPPNDTLWPKLAPRVAVKTVLTALVLAKVFAVLIIVILVLAILLILRVLARPSGRGAALEILKSRYARGEINKQEFEDKKKDLL